MRIIDADELMEHVWRDKLDSRELIAKMIDNAPTVKEISTNIPINIFERLISQGSCEDCISRQAVLSMQYRIDDSTTLSTRDVVDVDDIEDLPPVTPQPKTGYWILYDHGLNAKSYQCSVCKGFDRGEKGKYCKWCGMKMVEPQERSGEE